MNPPLVGLMMLLFETARPGGGSDRGYRALSVSAHGRELGVPLEILAARVRANTEVNRDLL